MRMVALLLLAAISLPAASEETPLERSNRILKEISEQFQQAEKPTAPRLGALPQPASAPSPAEIASRLSDKSKPPVAFQEEALMVFVSLSMPSASLRRIVEESERSGAKIVFRGFKDNSLRAMTKQVSNLLENHKVEAMIDPDAFRKFGVEKVPTTLIARAGNPETARGGCNPPADYIKVAGDVSQGFALDMIERSAPEFARAAKRFNSKLVRKP